MAKQGKSWDNPIEVSSMEEVAELVGKLKRDEYIYLKLNFSYTRFSFTSDLADIVKNRVQLEELGLHITQSRSQKETIKVQILVKKFRPTVN